MLAHYVFNVDSFLTKKVFSSGFNIYKIIVLLNYLIILY